MLFRCWLIAGYFICTSWTFMFQPATWNANACRDMTNVSLGTWPICSCPCYVKWLHMAAGNGRPKVFNQLNVPQPTSITESQRSSAIKKPQRNCWDTNLDSSICRKPGDLALETWKKCSTPWFPCSTFPPPWPYRPFWAARCLPIQSYQPEPSPPSESTHPWPSWRFPLVSQP